MSLQNTFDAIITKELPTVLQSKLIKGTCYFSEEYRLKEALNDRGVLEKYEKFELRGTNRNPKLVKMYSVGSSSRLCFLYFYKNNDIEFEHILQIKGSSRANYDAYDTKENIYYECKCHEIFQGKRKLKDTDYYRQILQKFDIKNIIKTDKYLPLTLGDFGLEKLGSKSDSIYGLSFDFKQLFTHVCGLISQNKDGKICYIFFRPKDIMSTSAIKEKYENIEKEIKIIQESKFMKILNNYGIILDYRFVTIEDDLQVVL